MSGVIKNISNWFLDKFFGIEPNISKLGNIADNKVLVQYTPPKGLSPSEVGMVYYRNYKASNINCMIYKRVNEGKISLKDEGSITHLKVLEDIDDNNPKYELSYWIGLTSFKRKYKNHYVRDGVHYFGFGIYDPGDLIHGLFKIQDQLLYYCIDKGWIKRSGKDKHIISRVASIILIFIIIFIALFYPLILFKLHVFRGVVYLSSLELSFYIWILLLAFAYWFVSSKSQELMGPNDLELTEKGKKLYAEIYGYKYFLEHCEEEKLQKLIKDDPNFIDKTLPYAVALRLNLSFLKRSMTNFSITKIEVDNSKLLMS